MLKKKCKVCGLEKDINVFEKHKYFSKTDSENTFITQNMTDYIIKWNKR